MSLLVMRPPSLLTVTETVDGGRSGKESHALKHPFPLLSPPLPSRMGSEGTRWEAGGGAISGPLLTRSPCTHASQYGNQTRALIQKPL